MSPGYVAVCLDKIVGYGLEVRHQAASQPDQLDVALALPLQTPARLHPIEVTVDVNLQQRRRMIGRLSCRLRLNTAKAQPATQALRQKSIALTGLSSVK
jgi:hypothetical protein